MSRSASHVLRSFVLAAIVLPALGAGAQTTLPDAPSAHPLKTRPEQTHAEAAEALRRSKLPYVNGMPYEQPSARDLTRYYFKDTYLLEGQARTTVRALYSEARGKPTGWGTDFPGFMQRFGSGEAVTAINGTVRLGMEVTFHEDLRYIPCRHCSVKRKIANALLSEVTARHGKDGRRIVSFTPAVADFSGPIIAHSLWYPGGFDPFQGVVATRVVAAIRVGEHLAQEYWVDRRHKHEPR
jgi:hypothetical protein